MALPLTKGLRLLWICSIIGLAACSSTVRVEPLGETYSALPPDCPITVVERPPDGRAHLIARVETHLKRNVFFGGRVTLDDDAMNVLRKQACTLGGDTVFIEDVVQTSALEASHLHVWAQVFRASNDTK